MYTGQLVAGDNYASLKPSISICLLKNVLFQESSSEYHHFRMADLERGIEIPNAIEVHTVELSKYNLREETIASAPPIEQWAFFFRYASQYASTRLRELLPNAEFQQAITTLESIAAKTEDKAMYDERQKAIRDQQWIIEGSREEGLQEGSLAGKIQELQELLGEEPQSTKSLIESYSNSELLNLRSELQSQLRLRMKQ